LLHICQLVWYIMYLHCSFLLWILTLWSLFWFLIFCVNFVLTPLRLPPPPCLDLIYFCYIVTYYMCLQIILLMLQCLWKFTSTNNFVGVKAFFPLSWHPFAYYIIFKLILVLNFTYGHVGNYTNLILTRCPLFQKLCSTMHNVFYSSSLPM